MKRIIAAIAVVVMLLASVMPIYSTAEETETATEAETETTTQEAIKDITNKCKFTVSDGSKYECYDGSLKTEWDCGHSSGWITVAFPEGINAGGLLVSWTFEPTEYTIEELDADKNTIRIRDQNSWFPCIFTYYELLPETRYAKITLNADNQTISEIAVYSEGYVPDNYQIWEAPVEKADIMFVSTHQDDEELWFGGAIPYYGTALDKNVVVVYMTNCSRHRRQEALNGLWAMGIRNYADFINFKDKYVDSFNEGVELWGGKDNIVEEVVERIRRYKPEVIVTHDLDGEYGHPQHKITAACMKYAIEAAADPTKYPESYEEYGAWQVKKLYHHLYEKNVIHMDWSQPMDELDGKTPLEVATIGFKQHKSQQSSYSMEKHGTKYDNTAFGLYYTTVGEDVLKNDFLENTDAAIVLSEQTEVEETEQETTAEETVAETVAETADEGIEEQTVEETPVYEETYEETSVETDAETNAEETLVYEDTPVEDTSDYGEVSAYDETGLPEQELTLTVDGVTTNEKAEPLWKTFAIVGGVAAVAIGGFTVLEVKVLSKRRAKKKKKHHKHTSGTKTKKA